MLTEIPPFADIVWTPRFVAFGAVDVDERDREIIEAFAGGAKDRRDEAIDVYRKALRVGLVSSSSPHLSFMSEIDNAVPDLLLRATYRKAVTG